MPTLADATKHSSCFVLAVDSTVPVAHRRRLAELGLRAGATFRVVQRTAGGGMVISNGASRYAVDKHTAANITVRPAADRLGAADAASEARSSRWTVA